MAVNPEGFTGSTAHDISAKKYGGPVRPVPSIVVMSTVQGRIVQNNPRRVALVFVNRSAFDITMDFVQPVVAGLGILCAANGGTVEMDVNDDGEIVAWELFGVSGGAGSNLYVLEVMRV